VSVVDDDIIESVFKDVLPGPGLALLLAEQEHDRLDDYDIIEMARAARRLASWAASLEYGAIAELSVRRKSQGEKMGAWDSEVGEWVSDEIAAALTLAGGTAAREVVVAEQLSDTLPATFQALYEGRIDADKAKAIATGLCGVPTETARQVEQQVLPAAPAQTCAQLRHAVRAAVRAADPEVHEQRRRLAEDARRLELWDTDQGTSDLTGRDLPATAATTAYNRINAIAQALKSDGDVRSIDQLRADILLDLIHNRRPTSQPLPAPTRRGSTPSSDTEIPLDGTDHGGAGRAIDGDFRQERAASINSAQDTGKDRDERAIADAVADAVHGQLTGLTAGLHRDGRQYGSQATLVREASRRIKEVVADLGSRWCVTTANADGHIIRHGADSYRIPAAMRRTVQTRDVTCRFPGCRRRATLCDIDHTVAHHKGGPTCPCNLAILCRRHHRLKQRPEWQIIQIWPGVLLWIAPTGHWYLTTPTRE
jgi:hypothetical protein